MKEPETSPAQVVPTGTLKKLKASQIMRSEDNPRRLFDPEPLKDLKDNIKLHGVLVPITVYQLRGQEKFRILDGERRHKCCLELESEGQSVTIPANIVEPPDKLARLLYMFSIHNFREQWQLMPAALGLKLVMKELGEKDPQKLSNLTGLSGPQVDRCLLLLSYPERFQKMSLDPDPKTRVPSNFWIEAKPVIDIAEVEFPDMTKTGGRDAIIDKLVAKYRAKSIKSVIHFRRIIEALDNSVQNDDRAEVLAVLRKYLEDETLETRKAFDQFVMEDRKIRDTVDACNEFAKIIQKVKIEHIVERDAVLDALESTRKFFGRSNKQDRRQRSPRTHPRRTRNRKLACFRIFGSSFPHGGNSDATSN